MTTSESGPSPRSSQVCVPSGPSNLKSIWYAAPFWPVALYSTTHRLPPDKSVSEILVVMPPQLSAWFVQKAWLGSTAVVVPVAVKRVMLFPRSICWMLDEHKAPVYSPELVSFQLPGTPFASAPAQVIGQLTLASSKTFCQMVTSGIE